MQLCNPEHGVPTLVLGHRTAAWNVSLGFLLLQLRRKFAVAAKAIPKSDSHHKPSASLGCGQIPQRQADDQRWPRLPGVQFHNVWHRKRPTMKLLQTEGGQIRIWADNMIPVGYQWNLRHIKCIQEMLSIVTCFHSPCNMFTKVKYANYQGRRERTGCFFYSTQLDWLPERRHEVISGGGSMGHGITSPREIARLPFKTRHCHGIRSDIRTKLSSGASLCIDHPL